MKCIVPLIPLALMVSACSMQAPDKNEATKAAEVVIEGWHTSFFDDFDTFNPNNWQDQMRWANNEEQCYVHDLKVGTM